MSTHDEELGSSTILNVDKDYLLHIEADHLPFARFLQKIKDQIPSKNGKSMSQRELASFLREKGFKINQPKVARHLSILTLPDHFVGMMEDKRLAFLTGYHLSKLSADRQSQVLDLALSELEESKTVDDVRIYQRHIDAIKHTNLTAVELLSIVLRQEDYEGEEYDPDVKEVVTPIPIVIQPESTEKIISPSELNSLTAMIRMKANSDLVIDKKIVNMFLLEATPVKKLMKKIRTMILEGLGEEYKVK